MMTAELAITGVGVIGASIAYGLAVRCATNITVLVRDSIASSSSGRAIGGIVKRLFGSRYLAGGASRRSIRPWPMADSRKGIEGGD